MNKTLRINGRFEIIFIVFAMKNSCRNFNPFVLLNIIGLIIEKFTEDVRLGLCMIFLMSEVKMLYDIISDYYVYK